MALKWQKREGSVWVRCGVCAVWLWGGSLWVRGCTVWVRVGSEAVSTGRCESQLDWKSSETVQRWSKEWLHTRNTKGVRAHQHRRWIEFLSRRLWTRKIFFVWFWIWMCGHLSVCVCGVRVYECVVGGLCMRATTPRSMVTSMYWYAAAPTHMLLRHLKNFLGLIVPATVKSLWGRFFFKFHVAITPEPSFTPSPAPRPIIRPDERRWIKLGRKFRGFSRRTCRWMNVHDKQWMGRRECNWISACVFNSRLRMDVGDKYQLVIGPVITRCRHLALLFWCLYWDWKQGGGGAL